MGAWRCRRVLREGFQYLVRFLERKLNRPFNDIAQELLFIPAGMHSSAMVRQDWYEGRLAWPLSPDGEWREPRSSDEALGAGGMRTTSQDYAKFIISILNGDGVSTELRDKRLRISRNQHERCVDLATRPESCPARLGFGLSWYIYEFDDETIVAHSGANPGERTLVVFSPSRRAALVVMTNGANGDQVIYEIADAVGVHKDFVAIERPRRLG